MRYPFQKAPIQWKDIFTRKPFVMEKLYLEIVILSGNPFSSIKAGRITVIHFYQLLRLLTLTVQPANQC